jgi:hypothetical protein
MGVAPPFGHQQIALRLRIWVLARRKGRTADFLSDRLMLCLMFLPLNVPAALADALHDLDEECVDLPLDPRVDLCLLTNEVEAGRLRQRVWYRAACGQRSASTCLSGQRQAGSGCAWPFVWTTGLVRYGFQIDVRIEDRCFASSAA